MKKAERNKMLQRYTDLLNRVDSLRLIIDEVKPTIHMSFGQSHLNDLEDIIKETEEELLHIKDLKDNRREYLFNFKGGGWNSELAFYEEEAVKQAIKKYGVPTETGTICNVDTTTFRISTPADYRNLMSNFY